jgi:hypothetical protein
MSVTSGSGGTTLRSGTLPTFQPSPLLRSSAPSTVMAMRDPYLDALEQLDQMRDRAFEAEATIQRVREVLERYRTSPYSEMSQTDALGAVGRALDGDA